VRVPHFLPETASIGGQTFPTKAPIPLSLLKNHEKCDILSTDRAKRADFPDSFAQPDTHGSGVSDAKTPILPQNLLVLALTSSEVSGKSGNASVGKPLVKPSREIELRVSADRPQSVGKFYTLRIPKFVIFVK